ncbi:flagellar basal-body MS-ring/collar protein FliF [Pelosinus propionicus]|uniref:Flagellar M-ring protein n=1 Tax=Pelosinus propionicus DSM 13327 TaxID=1123291 RepID=A0A1I4K0G3_9FIRM|nr:flagellar basal-body MS-ring/collar protein FliF [Pelosinus propionicus]SFL72051.1 flagellar M-ring protein FliF [Pelosinus propionicus DSM 13327]
MADWKEQSLRLWQNLGKKERYMILGSAILIFAIILAWSFWWGGRPDLVPLFTEMEAKDAGEVSAKLKEMKVTHEIGGNGNAIMVPAKDVYRIRLDLASQGLPRGNKGFEIFEQSKFGATEFQNKVNLVQALQGELARTIEQLSEVEKARVHIVLSEDSLYKKNEKPATASIMLKLRTGAQLSKEQIKGVVNLVAHSIQGLKPENITVVDQLARVLNEENDSNGVSGANVTLTQIEMTKKVQDGLQKDVQSLLEQVLGANKAAARVNVELSFDQRVVDRQTFEPVVDDKGIIRSSQEMNENFKGSAPNTPGGVPGTTTNVPGYVTANTNQSNYEKKEVIRNYEINETKEKVVATPGSIKRLTVAVLVDASVNKAQQDSILKTVSSAIGINNARGDTVSVESITFNTEAADKQRREEMEAESQQRQALWLKIGLAVITVLGILYILRMRSLRKRQEEERVEEEIAAATESMSVETPEMTAQEIQLSEQRKELERLAKAKPEEVAQLIKVWLSEE